MVGPHYKEELSNSYYLLIRLQQQIMQYAVYDPITNTFLLQDSIDISSSSIDYAEQEKAMLQNHIFNVSYRKVVISIYSPTFTTLPKALYQKEKAHSLLEFLGYKPSEKNDVVNANIIEMAAAILLFVTPKFLHYFIQTQFSGATIIHALLPDAQELLIKHKANDLHTKISVSINPSSTDICCAQNGTLVTLNSYPTTEVTDIVYCIMNLIQHLGIKQDDAIINVTSTANQVHTEQAINLLRKFARNVNVAQRPTYFKYDFPKNDNDSLFTNLYKIALCV